MSGRSFASYRRYGAVIELIEYGAARFDVVRTLRYERTSETDAANNYVSTHHDILVEVHFQPALAAYTIPGLFRDPVFTPGASPGETDIALLTHLLQPRRLLRITAGGSVILQTPYQIEPNGQRYVCDHSGGPTVEAVGIPQQIGLKHWVVTLHITADCRDRFQTFPQSKNAVVSNLWAFTEDIDVQRRSVRRFAGRAILRADVMRLANVNANNLRDLFIFACPPHYMRENVSVNVSEDGTVCDWSFTDAQRTYDLGVGSEIVKLECFRTGTTKRNSPAKLIFDTVRGITRAGNLVGAGVAILSAALDNLPASYVHARCDVTGDRNADLGRLTSIALGVCQTQVGQLGPNVLTGTSEITFRQDVGDEVFTSVELTVTFTSEALAQLPNIPPAFNLIDILRNGPNPAELFRIVNIARRFQNLPNDLADALDRSARAMQNYFQTDQRNLTMVIEGAQNNNNDQINVVIPQPPPPQNPPPPPPQNVQRIIIASRQGDIGFDDNPPLLQGAFGTVPQAVVGVIPTPIRNVGQAAADNVAAAALPRGTIPAGIEHLVVQALLGQNVDPPLPDTLRFDS